MHYGADMCLPRKKKVIQSFRSNTHRIFDEKVPDRLDANKIYNHHTYQRRTSEEINQLKTHNIPHPRNAKYIRSNVRFLNEPMAYIDVQQFNGWAKEAELNVKSTAPYSRNSTQRSDFQACPGTLAACTRYGMNPNKYPASGIVPTVSPTSTQKPLLEKICFIHQFDSRKPQDQAYEGKALLGEWPAKSFPLPLAYTWCSTHSSGGLQRFQGLSPLPLLHLFHLLLRRHS
ncbi:uncharacterized protein LOC125715441 isoform X3 [Brienomyrus brachyistius]|uniref:uncharacterized protein LOC125715441 isoform X3 n=1 Tax=Brienomyrus brachyistius TaxID=42636 RepID=UPI0020B2FF6B|nr:uncharacterized protein LOC125715441 isoform X3 [Brienomyrus brachyistius]